MRPPGVNGMDAEYRMQVVSRALLFYAHLIKCLCVCERQEWPLLEAVRLPDVAGYKRLPGLKRRLKLLAYTNVRDKISVIEASCFTCNGSFSRHHQLTFGILSPCHHFSASAGCGMGPGDHCADSPAVAEPEILPA